MREKETVILTLDQGTTSSRAIIFDLSGRSLHCAQQEFTQYFPRPGWVEHDANDIWTSTLCTARSALAFASASGYHVAAIGVTNQRETTVV